MILKPAYFGERSPVFMIELSPVEKIIARLLVNSAINKTGNFTYSELSDILAKDYGENVNPHYGLSRPLGNVAILCSEMSLPLLSVRVHYKNDKTGKTAEGFYAIACELIPEYRSMSPNDVHQKELQRTRDCKDWQRMLDYLDGKIFDSPGMSQLTLQEQMAVYVADIIARYGIGHRVTTQEIKDEIIRRYKSNPDSIIPPDYCYNRWNSGLTDDMPTFFEYVGRGEIAFGAKDTLSMVRYSPIPKRVRNTKSAIALTASDT
jgi:hypothetical protein